MRKITILGEDGKVEIAVLGRRFPEEAGTWEGDWVHSTISLEIPGYSAHFETDLRTNEFSDFLKQLKAMDAELKGTAAMEPLESTVKITGVVHSLGEVSWDVETCYPLGTGAVLKFTLGADQSYLPGLIKELNELLEEFPVLEKQASKTDYLKNICRKIRQSKNGNFK